jgi:superfamily II DNA/RNA helicase
LTPSQELAWQIMDVVKGISKYTAIAVEFIIKGVKIVPKEKISSQVIISTSDRLGDLIK